MKSKQKKSSNGAPLTYKVIHWVLFALVLVNLFLVFRFERDRKPVVVHETVTTISNHVWIVTNFIRSVSSDVSDSRLIGPTNELGGIKVNDPQYEIPLNYHFTEVNHQRYMCIGSFRFGIGDSTSYGRIVNIFPERVQLDNGYYIKNDRIDERYGFGRDALNYQREIERMNFSGSNRSVVVPVVPYTRGNYLGGYSSSSRKTDSPLKQDLQSKGSVNHD